MITSGIEIVDTYLGKEGMKDEQDDRFTLLSELPQEKRLL